jgi:transglutaminase-like putative cysteine protease
MRSCRFVIAAILLCACSGYAAVSRDAPSWVAEAASKTLPNYPGKVPAAVLLEEQRVSVNDSGLVTTRTRRAIKILTHDGQRSAEAIVPYLRGGSRVNALHAWLVAPGGFVKTYEKNSVADMGSFDEMELYNDFRFQRIRAENPEIGAVFAYESEVEERALFAQDEFAFQNRLPSLESRYTLTVPPGWRVKGLVFNHAPIAPVVDGSTYMWKLSDLPFREREVSGPGIYGLAPRLAISFLPSDGAAGMSSTSFSTWTDVSRWHTALSSGQDEVTPELAAKSRALTERAKSGNAKIQAIGQYVQRIKYVAIEMDLAHGGGYKPHAADLVFRKQYGDCKDKANLMRALLKAAGIESYLVGIYYGDRTYVREEWPSPSQFNHMIIAVRVSNETSGQTVVEAPRLGRVLLFDPTSETTPMGDLPWREQGSFALLMAGDKGNILKMPSTPPEANSMDVTVSAELASGGALEVSCALLLHGQAADEARARKFYENAETYLRQVLGFFSERASGITLSKLDSSDQFDENNFRLNLAAGSPAYGQLMQRRLLVFNPSILQPDRRMFPVNETRAEPIVLRAETYRKHVRIKLPAGFTIDELPQAVKRHSEWGEFSITFEQKAGELLMEEDLKIDAATLPPDHYKEVKKFFDEFSGADQQQAVLLKN